MDWQNTKKPMRWGVFWGILAVRWARQTAPAAVCMTRPWVRWRLCGGCWLGYLAGVLSCIDASQRGSGTSRIRHPGVCGSASIILLPTGVEGRMFLRPPYRGSGRTGPVGLNTF